MPRWADGPRPGSLPARSSVPDQRSVGLVAHRESAFRALRRRCLDGGITGRTRPGAVRPTTLGGEQAERGQRTIMVGSGDEQAIAGSPRHRAQAEIDPRFDQAVGLSGEVGRLLRVKNRLGEILVERPAARRGLGRGKDGSGLLFVAILQPAAAIGALRDLGPVFLAALDANAHVHVAYSRYRMPRTWRAIALAFVFAIAACAGPSRPSEEATPPPSPSPSPVLGCQVPPGVFNENCAMTEPTFYGHVQVAIEEILAAEPQMFDLGRRRGCERCFLVRDPDRFTDLLVARLETKGLCAIYDGEELGVKSSNDFNDQFDVLTFEFYLRRENGSYRSTCRPAWF
jgi:hypothetical protein